MFRQGIHNKTRYKKSVVSYTTLGEKMKKLILIVLSFMFCSLTMIAKENESNFSVDAKAAYLMEYTSGKVIYAKNENDKLFPASMTKMMGLLLIYEALHKDDLKLSDEVVTSEFAASMGGSQVFMEPDEVFKVEELMKCIIIASANDAMVAMAEKIGGSEANFVAMMNKKAEEIGLKNTHFENTTGLHDDNHYSSAKDMAIIGQRLVKEGKEELLKLTSTYDAYIREDSDSKFWLVNTNKLIKQYPGVDGLKTGYTTQSKSCITVTAKKQHLRLIAVVMGANDAKVRNSQIRTMLDYGFSLYHQKILFPKGSIMKEIKMENAKPEKFKLLTSEDIMYVYEKGKEGKIDQKEISMITDKLPYKKNRHIAKMKIVMSDHFEIETLLVSDRDVAPIQFSDIFKKSLKSLLFA